MAKLRKVRKSRGAGCLEVHGKTYRAHYYKLDPSSSNGFRRVCESTGIAVDGSDPEDANNANSEQHAQERAWKRAELWLEEHSAPYRAFIEHGKFTEDREKLVRVARGELAKVEGIVAVTAREIESAENRLPAFTLEEAWGAYEKAMGPRKCETPTHRNYNQWYHQFVQWTADNHQEVTELRQVNASIARQYSDYDRGVVSGSTHNRHINALAHIWRVLSAKEIDGTSRFPNARLGINPFAYDKTSMSGIERVRLEKDERPHRRRDLTLEELSLLISKTHGEYRILFALGIYTGLRLGDCVNLKRSNFDFAHGLITARSRKTDVETVTAIHPRLQAIINDESKQIAYSTADIGGDEYLLPAIAKVYNRSKNGSIAVSRRISRIFRSCGIETSIQLEGKRKRPHATFHSLRHTFVTQLARANVQLRSRQALSGHQTASMTEYYTHDDSSATLALPDVLEDAHSTAIRDYSEAVTAMDKLSVEDLVRLYRRIEFRLPKRHRNKPKDKEG